MEKSSRSLSNQSCQAAAGRSPNRPEQKTSTLNFRTTQKYVIFLLSYPRAKTPVHGLGEIRASKGPKERSWRCIFERQLPWKEGRGKVHPEVSPINHYGSTVAKFLTVHRIEKVVWMCFLHWNVEHSVEITVNRKKLYRRDLCLHGSFGFGAASRRVSLSIRRETCYQIESKFHRFFRLLTCFVNYSTC